jgi:glutamine cyclotransferase
MRRERAGGLVRRRLLTLLTIVTSLAVCSGRDPDAYSVVARTPHDPTAYTQGLVYVDGQLYESTGLLGQSQVRRVNRGTGQVEAAVALADDRFGEGLTLLAGKLYQLTWRSMVGYVYDAASLTPLDSFGYDGEGWGLTTDGSLLVMSDGTARLRFVDPATFAVVREVTVQDAGSPLSQLNELEYVDGIVFANVYPSDWIVRIDPESGTVLEWIDLARLWPVEDRPPGADVLNGIAWDAGSGHLLVTGKRWPWLYELRLTSRESGRAGTGPGAR